MVGAGQMSEEEGGLGMFWNDPTLYGANFRDLPGQVPMNVWHNVPKFIPGPYGFVPPYFMQNLQTPFIRPELTPFVRPELMAQFTPQLTPQFAPQFPQFTPQIPFNPYVNLYGWQRPFGF
jgi:hypothetical protein